METEVVNKPYSNKRRYIEKNQTRQWSSLPQDLLNLIMGKLYFTDRIRFRVVCKGWRIPVCDRRVNELPWILINSRFYPHAFLDPTLRKKHTIPNFDLSICVNATICASKCGWLLLSRKQNPNTKIIRFFLYSPFTSNVIVLPSLISSNYYYDKATFSSINPTSPDYVFFVVTCCYVQRKLQISVYRNVDNTWRTKILDGDYLSPVGSIVCTENGVCYIVLECGKLGVFTMSNQECSWLVDSLWISRACMNLVECNGDVLLAKISRTNDKWEVFRYGGNGRGWIEQKSLGGRALFIGCTSYLRPAVGDTADFADKILFHKWGRSYGSETCVYSLKGGNKYKGDQAYDRIVKAWHGACDWIAWFEQVWIETPY